MNIMSIKPQVHVASYEHPRGYVATCPILTYMLVLLTTWDKSHIWFSHAVLAAGKEFENLLAPLFNEKDLISLLYQFFFQVKTSESVILCLEMIFCRKMF